MEVAEKIYEGGTVSKNPFRADSNRAIGVRKQKGVESASSTNPETGRSGKKKTKIQVIRAID